VVRIRGDPKCRPETVCWRLGTTGVSGEPAQPAGRRGRPSRDHDGGADVGAAEGLPRRDRPWRGDSVGAGKSLIRNRASTPIQMKGGAASVCSPSQIEETANAAARNDGEPFASPGICGRPSMMSCVTWSDRAHTKSRLMRCSKAQGDPFPRNCRRDRLP
jgi:hypothetical protein